MVTLWDEPVLIGSVGEADGDAVRTSVRVGALNCLRLGVGPCACVLQETLLLGSGAVSRLVTASHEQVDFGNRILLGQTWAIACGKLIIVIIGYLFEIRVLHRCDYENYCHWDLAVCSLVAYFTYIP